MTCEPQFDKFVVKDKSVIFIAARLGESIGTRDKNTKYTRNIDASISVNSFNAFLSWQPSCFHCVTPYYCHPRVDTQKYLPILTIL